ncbi:hypothetical protein CSPHI_03065 [Corynebacterium sphenisci DSM 44792]|uniref:YdbS-like PH domain-containing protein n=1 Tax=Corynebacterium sphenisci DSM 44792 TaxID=1437874 RepID=A0A1L7CWM8_9CORY|nr:PH domain-containing protein [Corynebacterium sphenisci]APT90220.1 hypothetical protein CSPHI_03065 [Corynebacterium sphenisci DSM 44792]
MSGRWRRVHPATPLLRAWAGLLTGAAAAVAQADPAGVAALRRWLAAGPGWAAPAAAVAAVLALLLLGALAWAASLPWWRAMGFRVADGELRVVSGVLRRRSRSARLDRVQAVDLVEPPLPRLLGLAAVRVETAGGADSVLVVRYLRRAEAVALRAGLLDAAGPAEAAERPGGEIPAAPALVAPVPVARILAAAALRGTGVAGILAGIAALATPAGLAAAPVALAAAPALWATVDRGWRFTARIAGEEVVLGYGLAERRRRTIRRGRVHAVELDQPPLWRPAGWWRVRADVAGYGDRDDAAATTLLPAGPPEAALAVLTALGGAPAAAVAAGLDPGRPAPGALRNPARAGWVAPLLHRRRAVALVPGAGEQPAAIALHRGLLHRRVAVVAPARVQELTLRRGPAGAALGLAELRLDLVTGPVRMRARGLAAADAAALLALLRRRRLPPPEPAG